MDREQMCITTMINKNNKIYKELAKNKIKVRLIVNKIENMKIDSSYLWLEPIIEEIECLVQSLDYVYISCKSQKGIKNTFFPFTSFYRVIISIIKVINEKIKDTLKDNKIDNEDVEFIYNKLKIFMECEFRWRNSLEHGIDPFYNGEGFDILEELSISKIVEFIDLVISLLSCIKLMEIKFVSYKNIKIDYKSITLDKRKNIISKSSDITEYIFIMITQLSYLSRDIGLNEEGKNIVDIAVKYIELNKVIYYVYYTLHKVNKSYTRLKRDDYSYFIRMSISLYYQMFDKMGMYINNRYNLNLKRPYFKDVINKIVNNNMKDDYINNKLCELRNSIEYDELTKIRKMIIHNKKVYINYQENSDCISSLIVSSLIPIQNIIFNILKEFFYKNSLEITISAINESKTKKSNKKL